jgi:hypothetical protein
MGSLSQLEQKVHRLTAAVDGQRSAQPIVQIIQGQGGYEADVTIGRAFSRLFVCLDQSAAIVPEEEPKAPEGEEKPKGPGRPARIAVENTIAITIYGICGDRRTQLINRTKVGDGDVIELPYCPSSVRIEIAAAPGQTYSILGH